MCFEGIRSASAPPLTETVPGSIVQESIASQRAVYIPDLKFYPGFYICFSFFAFALPFSARQEFFQYFPREMQSVIVQPFEEGAIVVGSATDRGFGKLDQVRFSDLSIAPIAISSTGMDICSLRKTRCDTDRSFIIGRYIRNASSRLSNATRHRASLQIAAFVRRTPSSRSGASTQRG